MKTKDERVAQFQKENQALQERIDKMKMMLRGKGLLQEAKHIVWDSIVVKVSKFRVYLNFINDKDNMDITTISRCIVVNETSTKKPSEWAQNSINLLNSIPTAELQTIRVKYRTTFIIWAMRFIIKHNLLKSVQTKATQMEKSVQEFKDLFEEFFIEAFPPFWDGKGKLYDQEEYNSRFTQCRMDHSKFENVEENLKGATLVEHLITDFEILNQFKTVKIGLPVMTYASCIDLEILIKEIMDYDIWCS
jgi:hypothetical protein